MTMIDRAMDVLAELHRTAERSFEDAVAMPPGVYTSDAAGSRKNSFH